MMMFLSIFSTRELVSIFYLFALCIFGITKKAIRSSFFNLMKAFFCWKIMIPIILLFLYGFFPILFIKQLHFWKWIYIKDVCMWVVFAGIPYCLNISAVKEKSHFKSIILNNIKLAIVVEFIISSFTFNILVEFMLQPILLFLFLLQSIAESKEEYKSIEKILNVILVFMGCFIFLASIKIAIHSITNDNKFDLLISFLIPIVYSILFLPCAYFLALYSEYELLYVRMKVVYKNKNLINETNNELLKYGFWQIIKQCGLSINNLKIIDDSFLADIYSAKSKDDIDLFINKLRWYKKRR